MKLKRKKKGFTLIEMVIVIAIMGILIGLVSPSAMKALKSAKVQADAANARDIAIQITQEILSGNDSFNAEETEPGEIQDSEDITVPEVKAVSDSKFYYYVEDNAEQTVHIIVKVDDDNQWELYPELDDDYPNMTEDDGTETAE